MCGAQVRTKLIERLAKGGPVTAEQRKEMQLLMDRWEAAGGSSSDVAYLMLMHVYGAHSLAHHDASPPGSFKGGSSHTPAADHGHDLPEMGA